jgi:DnaJ-class molecular chaperone
MTEDDEPDLCEKCGAPLEYRECEHCGGEGVSGHDCGEDTCCCLDPYDNVECDICSGTGKITYCPVCHPEDA